MQRVLSTYLFVNRKLTPALLAEIARAGIPAIELFCARSHFDYRAPQEVRELAGWLSEHRLSLHSVHAPTERDLSPGRESGAPISIADLERLRRLEAVEEIKRALELADLVPFRFLVLHLGTSREMADPHRWDAAFNSLEHLIVFAKQRGVAIALENTPGELATPANLRQFIQYTRLHDLRLCFDLGHAHLEEGPAEERVARSFETMRELVVTTHCHDNHGERDEHLFPYEGTIDWNAALKLLAGGSPHAPELPIVLELREQGAHAAPAEPPAMPGAVRAVFEKFQRALAAGSAPGGS